MSDNPESRDSGSAQASAPAADAPKREERPERSDQIRASTGSVEPGFNL